MTGGVHGALRPGRWVHAAGSACALGLVALLALGAVPGDAQQDGATPPGQVPIDDVWCAVCHFDQGDQFALSVHYQKGLLLCNDCHGGDPTQPQANRAKAAETGFIGRPPRQAVAGVCGRCHTGPAEAFARGPHGNPQDPDNPTCVTCHHNHSVVDATLALIDTACAACHRQEPASLERGQAVQGMLRDAARRLDGTRARFDSLSGQDPAIARTRPLLEASASALRSVEARTHALDLADLAGVVAGFDEELGAASQALDDLEAGRARRRRAVVAVWAFVAVNLVLLRARRRQL